MAEKNENKKPTPITQTKKAPRDFSLIKEIRKEKEYKHNNMQRDVAIRKIIEKELPMVNINKARMIGQMVYFDYFEPKTEEQLKFYDAKPCTIIFGRFKTLGRPDPKNPGKRIGAGQVRILGFNIHYYPPRMRFQVVNRIYEIFKPYYDKGWTDGLTKDMSYVQYQMLIDQLAKAKLSFGVREYIPELINKVRIIPTNYFSKAVFTEGYFKKQSRTAIMNHWKQFKQKP